MSIGVVVGVPCGKKGGQEGSEEKGGSPLDPQDPPQPHRTPPAPRDPPKLTEFELGLHLLLPSLDLLPPLLGSKKGGK